jgi:solute:Na+ symporter, SSS family
MTQNILPQLSNLDLSIIIGYIVMNAFIGFITFKRKGKVKSEVEEYILAGRKLTLPAFVASLVSTWYGGIIAVGEYAYDNGIVTWIVFGVPYYVAGLVFAWLLAKRVNSDTVHVSIPDRLHAVYGKHAGYIGAIATALMTSPAAYIMMLATLYEWFFGFSYVFAVAIAIISSITYLFYGGFRASVRADVLQFILMFIGFGVILPYAFSELGGLSYLTTHLPDSHTKPFGNFSMWYVLVWYLAAMTTLVDPNVHQRVFAVSSPKIAQKGMYWSIGFWVIFDFMTNATGLYAFAKFPDLPESKFAYPALAEYLLPAGIKGLFYTGMLATVLSTVDSFTFTSATIIGRDIIWRIWGRGREDKEKRFVQIGLVVTALLSIAVISLSTKIYLIWYSFSSVLVPTLLLPLTLSYFPKYKPSSKSVLCAMIVAVGVSLLQFIIGYVRGGSDGAEYLLGIEPMLVGLIASVAILLPAIIQKGYRNGV